MTSLFVFSFYCKLMIFFFCNFCFILLVILQWRLRTEQRRVCFFSSNVKCPEKCPSPLRSCVPALFLLFCFRLQLRRSQAPAPDCRSQNGFGENGPRAFVWGRSVFVSLIWPCNKECEKAAVTTGAEEKHRLCSHESAEREGPKVTEKALK